MKNTLKEALRPLYEPMLKDERISVLSEQDYCCMAPFVGNKFPKTPNDGIIYYVGQTMVGQQALIIILMKFMMTDQQG